MNMATMAHGVEKSIRRARAAGGALLRACKSSPGPSSYLRLEPRGAAVLRAPALPALPPAAAATSPRPRPLPAVPADGVPAGGNRGDRRARAHALPAHRGGAAPLRATAAGQARLPLSLPLVLGEEPPAAQARRRLRRRCGAGPGSCPAAARPVRQSAVGRSEAPPLHSPRRRSRRTEARRRQAREVLFLTGTLLRALQASLGGVL